MNTQHLPRQKKFGYVRSLINGRAALEIERKLLPCERQKNGQENDTAMYARVQKPRKILKNRSKEFKKQAQNAQITDFSDLSAHPGLNACHFFFLGPSGPHGPPYKNL